jgi:transmembrane sensor
MDSRQHNTRIHEQACEWFVEFRTCEPSESARRAFLGWLKESPTHMGAYLEVTALWRETAPGALTPQWNLEDLVREAKADRGNVVTLGLAEATQTLRRHARPWSGRSHGTRVAILSAAASLLVFALAALVIGYAQRNVYVTGIGEQRSVTLADGSTVQLNSRSKLRVRYSAHVRRIDLQAGQALFNAAKDASRPFIVVSGDTQVRAVGTQFDVYRKSQGTVVTVVEGRVAVLDAEHLKVPMATSGPQPSPASSALAGDAKHRTLYLDAGEQLSLTAPGGIKRPANIAAVTAWTQRQLLFESTPLAEVAEEFNRYNRRHLVLKDHSLDDFEIDGVFSSTDPSSLVRFLRSRAGVRTTETDSTILLERAEHSP